MAFIFQSYVPEDTLIVPLFFCKNILWELHSYLALVFCTGSETAAILTSSPHFQVQVIFT